MAAQNAWRQILSLLLGLGLAGLARAQDSTFLSGEELAARLRQNLVWIAAQDIGEHGYGLVVGGDAQTLWVLTARHVVVRTSMRGSPTPEEPSRQIRLRFCAATSTELLPGQPWPGWDAGGEDIALLSVARPRGYQPVTRALAPQVAVGEPVWLLGSNDECSLVPAQGQVRVLADAAHNLRIDFAGVQGGSSGAPVLSGSGVLGLMKSAEDLTTTVHAIADLQRRLQALPGLRWELVDARNIPPTDPRAAEIDLAETLNQYLLVLRNMHMLLQQRQVARPTLDDYMQRYNAALRRFLRVREAYDGSLNRYWPPPVGLAWQSLRETLWAVHQNFWRINPLMADIYKSQQSSVEVRAQMASLEPGLVRLESDIAQFLRLLAKEN
ncbi:MAG: serine protease [Rhodoferax sp.]|nr:serine protease [Rhodoferax sp.]